MSSKFIDQVKATLPNRVRVANWSNELEPYSIDRTRTKGIDLPFVIFPESTNELATIIKIAYETKQPLMASGGRTGYSGGAVVNSNEAVISFEKMNRLLGFDPYLPAIKVGAGMTTRQVQQFATDYSLYFPVDFASADSSQIGGNLATNAGGIRVFRYGSLRHYVIGLTAVDGRGRILHFSDLIKDNTGYDLKQLLIGSEGTLAFISEVTLKLISPPPPTKVALLSFTDFESLLKTLAQLRTFDLYAFEFFDLNCLKLVCNFHSIVSPFQQPEKSQYYALIEYAETLDDEKLLSLPAVEILTTTQNQKFWIYRESISEALSISGLAHKNDVSVPINQLKKYIDELIEIKNRLISDKAKLFLFGHIADGNIHVNLLWPKTTDANECSDLNNHFDLQSYQLLSKLGGSISAEHGIGQLKRQFLTFSKTESEIEIMKSIKASFDPANILNKGRIFL